MTPGGNGTMKEGGADLVDIRSGRRGDGKSWYLAAILLALSGSMVGNTADKPGPTTPRPESVILKEDDSRMSKTSTNSAANPKVISLSIADAVSIGLANSTALKIANSQTRQAAAGVMSARSAILPSVNGTYQYTHTIQQVFTIPGVPFLPFAQPHMYTMGISGTQPVYRPGSIRGIQIAKGFLANAKDQESEIRLELVLEICQAYYGSVLANTLAEIARLQIALLDRQLEEVRLQRKTGNASDLDVLRVEVNRSNTEPELIRAIDARDDALRALRNILTLADWAEVKLTDQLSTEGFTPVSDNELNHLVYNALSSRPRIQAAEELVRVRENQVKAARSAFYPSIDAVGNFGEMAFPNTFWPSTSSMFDNWTIGFQINLPLFSGFRRIANIRTANEQAIQARESAKQAQQDVVNEATTARRQLIRTAGLVQSRAEGTTRARRVFELTDLAFREGSANYLDIDNARMNLAQASANETQAVHDYYMNYLRLLRVVGIPARFSQGMNPLKSNEPPPGFKPLSSAH